MRTLAIVFTLALLSSTAFAAPILSEDFESYANQAALDAVWAPTATALILSTAQNHTAAGSQSAQSTGGTTSLASSISLGADYAGSVGDPLRVECWYYDESTGAHIRSYLNIGAYASGETLGWGNGALENYIAFGNYNATSAVNYSRRVVFGGSGWVDTGVARSVGWHELEVVCDGTSATFSVDGSPAGVDTYAPGDWNCIRLGSGISSLVDACFYDDLLVWNNVNLPVELSLFSAD